MQLSTILPAYFHYSLDEQHGYDVTHVVYGKTDTNIANDVRYSSTVALNEL